MGMRGLVKRFAVLLSTLAYARSRCYRPVSSDLAPAEVSFSPSPININLPENWDWRDVGGKSFVSNVLTQQSPHVCGSCWAEAATGALSDRFKIATNGTMQVNLAVQVLLNYDENMSGGSCFGGDDYVAARFFYKYGIPDDTCAPFLGVDFAWGFDCCDGENKTSKHVQEHMCYGCDWDGTCKFMKDYRLYRASEYGRVKGERAMMAEIYARGPIACSVDSNPNAFDEYKSGIITSAMLPKRSTDTDHVIVIAGFGVDPDSGMKFWVGRNSYGTRWGEGRGGGWFRLQRGDDTLLIESGGCSWSVPHPDDVARVMNEYHPQASTATFIV